jgi:hypothetical protein
MLTKIVDIVLSSEYSIDSGTLFCKDVSISDQSIYDCISYLESKLALENTDFENKIGNKVNLELTLSRLNTIGFYENFQVFIIKNKYIEPESIYYILEYKAFSNEPTRIINNYRIILALIESIEHISKHIYFETDLKFSIILSEDSSLVIPLEYNPTDCELITGNLPDIMSNTIQIFKENNSEKKLLYLNELLSFLIPIENEIRFSYLIQNLETYFQKSNSAFQFYLRDFSYNKLKVELDSKALEFTQKIQGVINDSQTKLIAIPTAFVLVIATFDFEKIISNKNIGSIISLFIFSVLIQLFLNNQRSTLKFIKQNIDAYKETFTQNIISQTSKSFNLVEIEFNKQDYRLKIVEVILWSIPLGMLCFSMYLLFNNLSMIFVYLAIIITHAFLRFNWSSK